MAGDEPSGSATDLEFVTTIAKTMRLDHPVRFVMTEYEMPESVNFEGRLRSMIRKKKQQLEAEDNRRDQSPSDEDINNSRMHFNQELERERILSLVQTTIKCMLEGDSKVAITKFQTVFDEITKFPSLIFNCPKDYVWTKYAYFFSLIKESNYSDLVRALKLLQELHASLFSDLPVYHYAMAELLIKFNRFRLAENEIKFCQNAMQGHSYQTYYWPVTDQIIEETTRSGLEDSLNGLLAICGCYHKPDAVCKYTGCIEASSHPFPSREIFISDPDFKGYVVLICQEGCKIQYHPLCWKKVKDAFSNLDKLSDKDCIGKPCMTPDCKNSENEPSVIHKIEIIGSYGKVKSQCGLDHLAERQREIALSKKRLRLKSDEHKAEKSATKNKPRKKAISLNHAQSSEDIAPSMKNPAPKENNTQHVSGSVPAKANPPAKKEDTKHVEKVTDETTQKDFICSYFHMLLTKKGPIDRKQFDEEWDRFYPNIEPFYNLVPEKGWVFNLLKSSNNFSVIGDYIHASESISSSGESEHNNGISNAKQETSDNAVENKSIESKGNVSKKLKIKELQKELKNTMSSVKRDLSATNRDVNSTPGHSSWMPKMESTSTQMVDTLPVKPQLESILEKDVVINNSNPLPQGIASRPLSFGFFEDISSDNSMFNSSVRDKIKLPEVSVVKSPNPGTVTASVPIQEDFRVINPPYEWRDEVLDARYANPFLKLSPNPIELPEILIRKDEACQTDLPPEPKRSNDDNDELWVKHMQLAVNDLLKRNKELMKSKEQMEIAHKSEVDALTNQIQTLRSSFGEQIKVLKENHARNFEDDRRMMGLEARIKVQEQILQSTREELRKKDFDLLAAKKYLGIAILERLERESTRQVQRLVAALAVLPCSGPDADAVGQAMARWETAGDQACKAKNSFLEECAKCQAMLYEGYGSDSFRNLTIPLIEEPVGQCPLDKLSLNLLSEKEIAESNPVIAHPAPSYGRMSPYRMRNTTVVPGIPQPSNSFSYHSPPSHTPGPIPQSPINSPYGARPRDLTSTTNGESSETLQRWASNTSIPNSTQSSTGNASALPCSKKLLIELKRCYPSRSDGDLHKAVEAVRRSNKYTLSGLTIKRIAAMVGNVLDWWPEPSDGAMGLDKFIGWAADALNPPDDSCRGAHKSAWSGANSSAKGESEKEDCCICLQAMSSPKTELSCSHGFHTECIRQWLSKESVCPICRKFTRMADEFPSL